MNLGRPTPGASLFPEPAHAAPPSPAAVGWVKVAVERGLDRHPEGLTYALLEQHAEVAPGDRVLVPLGAGDRATPGWVVARLDEPDLDPARCKPIVGLDREGLQLPRTLMALAAWTSGYYAAPLGVVLQSMIPAAVKRATGRVRRIFVDLADAAREAALPTLPKGQRAAIEVLRLLPAEARPVEVRALADQAGLRTTGPIRRLIERELLVPVQRSGVEAKWRGHASDARAPGLLTAAQEAALAALRPEIGRDRFSGHLLFGVTGSGKTEVYIRLIADVLAAGRTALVLVPEIALTPQTGARLLGRFPGHAVAVLHSGLTAAQRHHQWSLVARGEADVVLGARSAVFAPIPDGRLGLVVVDEEHDSSFKSGQAPRYHGRDVAVRLAQLARCPVVLGSATPSLESWRHATTTGRLALHRLPERVPGAQLPHVRIVDIREEERETAAPSTPEVERQLGPALAKALSRTLADGGQAILLLNRRGWASYLACANRRCGWSARCPHCDVSVVLHRSGEGGGELPADGIVRCHHCQAEARVPRRCPDCGGAVRRLRPGTQRLEDVLRSAFPLLAEQGALARVDADTMRTGARYHDVMTRFADGRIRVLMGTQMIAKGIDVAGVRLVGVIDADTALHLPDFRAAERTFQLVAQVAGRTGRGREAGAVIVRTLHPNDPAIELSARHDYERFAAQELAVREDAGLPPCRRMIRIVVRDPDEEVAEGIAVRLAAGLEGDVVALGPAAEGVEILDAVPCPVARVADHFRYEVLLQADGPGPLQAVLARARSRGGLGPGHRVAVDVDPVAVL